MATKRAIRKTTKKNTTARTKNTSTRKASKRKTTARKTTARKTTAKRVARVKKEVLPVEKVDFSDSYEQVTKTAKVLNKEVRHAFNEIASDLVENGKIIGKATVKEATKLTTKLNKAVSVKNIKKTTNNIKQASVEFNDYTLTTAEDIVDGALATGEKWQAVTSKAIKGSLKLAAKQQNIMFDTLEAVKGQFSNNVDRVKKFFSKN